LNPICLRQFDLPWALSGQASKQKDQDYETGTDNESHYQVTYLIHDVR